MKVFISWSGDRSRAVAEVLSDWIKCVLQASEPWISTRHIDRGSLWFSEINEKLRDISVGIVCLTQENKDKPWILFESGALAKGLSGNRVCTFLVDLQPHDLTDPLAQFNHTKPNKESVWELVRTLNSCLIERALDERVLEKAFEVYWPIFEKEFSAALENNLPTEAVAPRPPQDIMMEILTATREMNKRVSNLETRQASYVYPGKKIYTPAAFKSQMRDMLKSGMSIVDVIDDLMSKGLSAETAKVLVNQYLEGSSVRSILTEAPESSDTKS